MLAKAAVPLDSEQWPPRMERGLPVGDLSTCCLNRPQEANMMLTRLFTKLAPLLLAFGLTAAHADDYSDTIQAFRKASESSSFFGNSYGYAVFPTIGKAGAVVGGAHGKGQVYEKGTYVGDASMTQVTVGAQLGGQAFSQIIFFQDKRAFDQFTGGEFEFGAQVTAVA
ncbi:MAG TPA: lipid-binding SYLF domain-containing protein, partial [Burkholderiaceae bacterium]|nr:lipid-binding SYLF domain-containing protein [Burkholderiaceae bacterium]